MIEIRRATASDADTIRRIYCHADVLPFISDDGLDMTKMDFGILAGNPMATFLIFSDEGRDIGTFFFYPVNHITYELHTAFLPGSRGAVVKQASLLAREYMFTQTPCRKVVTSIPVYNKKAYLMARMCGMEQEGLNRRSYLKDGVIYDQYVMGICKEEVA